ncbi:MAG: septal ring lytic transglycosylase RlpA family protein [Nitrospinae bacterium]|nr:septal ring lytic transglycosylase RlpA family protein [Nitrospinota bacterium]
MKVNRYFLYIIILLIVCNPSCHLRTKVEEPYRVKKRGYYPLKKDHGFVQDGIASWYGKDFHGRKTSNGEIYDMYGMTAAHNILPFNTYVKVINLENGRTTNVRINDRGPFIKDRIIDLTYTAAKEIGIVDKGTAKVKIEALGLIRHNTKGEVEYIQPESYTKGRFSVQIGAFKERDNANKLRERLLRSNKNSNISVFNNGDDEIFYQVRVGRYNTLNDAINALSRFKSTGYIDAFVVSE